MAPQINFLYNDHEIFIAAPESVHNNDYISHFKNNYNAIIYKNSPRGKTSFFSRFFSIFIKYIILFKYHKLNKFDVIIFNTITKDFHFFLIKLFLNKVKKIHIMHNSQRFLNKKRLKILNLFFNNLLISYDAYNRFKNDIDNLIIPLPMINWFYPLLPFSIIEDKKCFNITFNNSLINIIIPGSINEERRNYSSLFKALEVYKFKNDLKFKIYLLGKISFDMLEKIKILGLENIIIYFTEFISGLDMLNCLKNTDALAFLLDSKIGKNFINYNKYKVSGTTNLCLSFGTPCIVSDEYLLEDALREKALIYPNDKIGFIFEQIENGSLTKETFLKLRSLPLNTQCSYNYQKEHYLNALGIQQ